MRTHDNGEILILVLNNNTSPQGLVKCASAVSWHDGDENKSWRTSREQKVKGGGVMCCWGKSWTQKWQTRGDKWARWQTVSAVPRGRRGNSAPLIMRWPSLKKLLLAAAVRNFSYVSPLRYCTPSLTGRHMINFQPEYEHISAQGQNILPILLLNIIYLTSPEHQFLFCLNLSRVTYSAWRSSR